MSKEKPIRCDLCAWYAHVSDHSGHCHYYPPQPKTGVPLTGATGRCSKFKRRKEVAQANGGVE